MGSSKKHKDKGKDRETEKDLRRERKRRLESDGLGKHGERRREELKNYHTDDNLRSNENERRKQSNDHDDSEDIKRKRQINDDTELNDNMDSTTASSDLSLSVEETNRLRAKLGMRPLQTSEKAKGEEKDSLKDDIHVPAINIGHNKQTELLKNKLEATKEKRKIRARLDRVKTLADSDSDDDAINWVEKTRKLQAKQQKEQLKAKLAEQYDDEFGTSALIEEETIKAKSKAYDSKHLSGLKVEHAVENFKEGKLTILTLKDKGILDKDDDDVLVNINMMDDEKAQENVMNKKMGINYKAYDDTEFDEFGQYKPKEVLQKYNDEIDGKKKELFELKVGGKYDMTEEHKLAEIKAAIKSTGQSLKMENKIVASEYYTQSEIEEMAKFKKIKKKVRKVRRKVLKASDLEEIVNDNTDTQQDLGRRNNDSIDEAGYGKRRKYDANIQKPANLVPYIEDDIKMEEDNFIGPDDDLSNLVLEEEDVQRDMEEARKIAIRISKKNEQQEPESIIDDLIDREGEEVAMTTEGGNVNVMLDSTSEFCRNLGEHLTYGTAGNRIKDEEVDIDKNEEDSDDEMEIEPTVKTEGKWEEIKESKYSAEIDLSSNYKSGLEEEPILNQGISAALKLAANKGYLSMEDKKLPTISAKKIQDLTVKSYAVEDRRYDDIDDKFHRKRERYSGLGSLMDFKELSNYKPDVKLDYVDSQGKMLSPKEAFRQLSHRFHGKGPGKKKTEKRIKKLELEHMINHMSSSDTPLGSASLLYDKQIKEKTPFIVLSGGGKAFSSSSHSISK